MIVQISTTTVLASNSTSLIVLLDVNVIENATHRHDIALFTKH